MSLLHRVSAVALSVSLITVNATTCTGWAPTSEARLACCNGAGACPMHEDHFDGPSQTPAATASHADDCCAASERRRADQPDFTGAAALPAVLLTLVVGPADRVPALDITGRRGTIAPIPASAVPRHVLLSVFLV